MALFKFIKSLMQLGILVCLYYFCFSKEGAHIAQNFVQKNLSSPKNIHFLQKKIEKMTGFNLDEVTQLQNSDED